MADTLPRKGALATLVKWRSHAQHGSRSVPHPPESTSSNPQAAGSKRPRPMAWRQTRRTHRQHYQQQTIITTHLLRTIFSSYICEEITISWAVLFPQTNHRSAPTGEMFCHAMSHIVHASGDAPPCMTLAHKERDPRQAGDVLEDFFRS